MSNCAFCSKHKYCKFEDGMHLTDCPTVNERDMVKASQEEYLHGQYSDFMLQSLRQVAAGYEAMDNKPHPIKTRLEEIIDFCHRMGYQKLGLAFCTGLEDDAKVMAKVLRKNGFEVISAVCKVGGLEKEEVGLEDAGKIIPGRREISCNPLLQAELMNKAGTDFNIVFGLCLGHDSLFLKASNAMCTVFVVKDRALHHNLIAALDAYREL